MSQDRSGQYDERVERPWVFIGVIVVEIAVLVTLWAFGRYFG